MTIKTLPIKQLLAVSLSFGEVC